MWKVPPRVGTCGAQQTWPSAAGSASGRTGAHVAPTAASTPELGRAARARRFPLQIRAAAITNPTRLELEALTLTIEESLFALAALTAFCRGDREANGVLRRLLRKVRPTLIPRVS